MLTVYVNYDETTVEEIDLDTLEAMCGYRDEVSLRLSVLLDSHEPIPSRYTDVMEYLNV